MASPRAFVSFQMEDQWARDFLVEHAHGRNNAIEFIDYSLHQPFDEKWKTNCRERIARTRGTIVLIGPTSYRAEAVLWEIAETTKQGHSMFGIQIHRERTHPVPKGVTRVIRWDFEDIVRELNRW